MDDTTLSIDLPLGELLECAVVAGRFVVPDERSETGNVWLTTDDGHRVWRVSTPAVTLELRGGNDPAQYDLLMPPRLLNATGLVAGTGETVSLAAGTDRGRPAVELSGPGGHVTVTVQPGTLPERQHPLTDAETAASAVVDAAVLRETLALATQVPYGFDSQRTPWPAMTVSIEAEAIEVVVDWPTFGVARHVVPATTHGSGRAAIMPGAIAALLDAYSEEEILVKLPRLPFDRVELSWQGWTGSIPQVDLEGDWPADAEEVILEVFGPEAVDSSNGVYSLASDPDVCGRFSDEPPWRLELSAVVLSDVAASSELLSELNDHNRHLGLARVAWSDGAVVMHADLLIESLDAAELRTTVRWMRHHTTRLAPVLAAVFGGSAPNHRSQESR